MEDTKINSMLEMMGTGTTPEDGDPFKFNKVDSKPKPRTFIPEAYKKAYEENIEPTLKAFLPYINYYENKLEDDKKQRIQENNDVIKQNVRRTKELFSQPDKTPEELLKIPKPQDTEHTAAPVFNYNSLKDYPELKERHETEGTFPLMQTDESGNVDFGKSEKLLKSQNEALKQTPKETGIMDIVVPFLKSVSGQVPDYPSILETVDNVKKRYGDFGFDDRNYFQRVADTFTQSKDQIQKSAETLFGGLDKGNMVEVANGVFGLAFTPINLAVNYANNLPMGKVVSDYYMCEPLIVSEIASKIVEGVAPNLNPGTKELITNASMMIGLHLKGYLLKNKISPKQIESPEIKQELETEARKYYDEELSKPIENTLNKIDEKVKNDIKQVEPETVDNIEATDLIHQLRGKENANQKQSTAKVSIRKTPGDSKTLGKGDELQKPAGKEKADVSKSGEKD